MTNITRTFTREFMEDNDFPFDLLDKEFIEEHRWFNVWTGVFEYEGKYYRVTYLDPSTEMQEEDPWSDEETVIATQVVRLPVVKYEWVEVENI